MEHLPMSDVSPKMPNSLSRPRVSYGLAAAGVIVCGAIPRFDQLGHSLSIAESWVANSVLARSMSGMFYCDRWLQTTPPLFLVLVRSAVRILGVSPVSLRAVPLAFGILSLVVVAKLAGAILRPVFALICTALVAMSPYAAAYSKELKSYSSDVFTTSLLLWAIWMYVRSESRRNYIVLLLVFTATLLLSYIAVVFVPLAILVLLLGTPAAARRCTGLLALTGMLSGVDYFVFIRPNSSDILRAFWAAGFPPAGGGNALRFYMAHFVPMPFYFYFPAGEGVKDVLASWVGSMPGIVQAAAGIAVVVGIILAVRSMPHRRPERYALLFFVVPFSALWWLNRIGLYPVSSRRLVFFMLPCVALASAAVLQLLWSNVRGLWKPAKPLWLGRARGICGTTLVLLIAAGIASHPGSWDMDTSEDAGMDSALRYLKAGVRQNRDLVYVHAWEEEPARLYVRILHWEEAPVRYGHTGYPCCKRVGESRPTSVASEREYVLNDFRKVIGQKPDGNLWLVLPEPFPGWGRAVTDEPRVIIASMKASGCRQELMKRFESVDVYEFNCYEVNSSRLSRTSIGDDVAGLTIQGRQDRPSRLTCIIGCDNRAQRVAKACCPAGRARQFPA
jgi:hypothetical protein